MVGVGRFLRANTLYNIDESWARSLKGLRLSCEGKCFSNIPQSDRNKWVGGTVNGYNNSTKLWKVIFDTDTDKIKALRYESIIKYIDETASNYDRYDLPNSPVPPETPVEIGPTKYTATNKNDWTHVLDKAENTPIPIQQPVPFEGDEEEFGVDITPAELDLLKDEQGVIRFEKNMEWCMPRFDDDGNVAADGNVEEIGLFKWQAKQMSNYLRHLLMKELDSTEKRFVPWVFHPILEEGEDESKKKYIEEHHVARLYGVIMARMLSGDPSISNMYDSRSWFNHCAPAVESMSKDCLQDLYRLLHFVDDWEGDEDNKWDDRYDHPKVEAKEGTALH